MAFPNERPGMEQDAHVLVFPFQQLFIKVYVPFSVSFQVSVDSKNPNAP
jgi:hypothetical protein